MNSVQNWQKALLASAMAFGVGYAAQPKNIILMISDGWGYNQILAADYYKYGAAQASSYRAFPVALPMSTYSAGGNGYAPTTAQSDATYVKLKPTDSAASGTAIASGIKTYDAAINMDMDSIPVVNIAERAQTLGKAAGVVTSVEFSHATPAAMVAHNKSRNNYAEIANEMIYSSGVEVIIGAGHPEYTDDGIAATTKDFKYVGGETSWNDVKAGTAKNFEGKTWSFIESKADFESLANGTGAIPDQLIGVAQVRTTLQQARSGGASDDVVGEVPFNSNVPDLATLSKCALNVLNKNDKGFFLMVEGGAVDWAGHANQSARNIEEQMDFNTAVDSVVAWIGRNGGFESNLLIVTGDHETGYLTGADAVIDADPLVGKVTPVSNNGQGNMPGMKWNSGDHTNQLIPLYAQGAGAELLEKHADEFDPMRKYFLRNSEIGQTFFELWPDPAASVLQIPRYTFLLISDGAGYNTFAAADMYQQGTAGVQQYNNWPVRLPMSTYSAGGNGYAPQTAKADATYVRLKPTDSAASGTALSTGLKTYDAAINVDMDTLALQSMVQTASAIGQATGVVTTVQFSHATPAAMVAHNKSRNNYAAIAEEMLTNSDLDVIIGAGHPFYDDNGDSITDPSKTEYKYVGGQTLWEKLADGSALNSEGNKWTMVNTKAQFDSLASLDRFKAPSLLVGVPQVRTTLQQARSGATASDAVYGVALNDNVPDLATLTKAAIHTLDKNPKGFFVMVEGGAVDWAGHANQSARSIEEQLDFNAMVDSVITWIEHNNAWDESLVIVTADHETGYLTGSTGGKLINKGKGKMPGMKWNSGDHTNQLVPFFAKGSGAEFLAATADNYDPMRGYHTDNAKVGQVLQTIYREGKVPAERIDPSSSSAASSSSATSSSSSSTNSSSSTKPSSSSSGSVKPSSSSATTALSPATTLRTSSLQVQGKAVLVHIGQSGVARLVVNNVDGTRQAVLMNGYANAGFYRFALPVTQGAGALVLETADGRKVLNISSMR